MLKRVWFCFGMMLFIQFSVSGQQHLHRFTTFQEQPGAPEVYKKAGIKSFQVLNKVINSDSTIVTSPFEYRAFFNAFGQKVRDSANTRLGFSNRFVYDERQRLVAESYANEKHTQHIKYTYDSNVLLIKEEEFDDEGKLRKSFHFDYNQEGKMAAVYYFRENITEDTLTATYLTYDQRGLLKTRKILNRAAGYLITSEYTYVYDKEKRLTNVTEAISGHSAIIAEYDYPTRFIMVYKDLKQERSIDYHFNLEGLLERKVYRDLSGIITGESDYLYQRFE